MKRAGIVGWPVSHSLSPLLHGYWLKEHGIAGEYLRLPARPEEFKVEIARLRDEGFAGVNVTVPHKEAAFKLAGSHDKAAEISGAVNLLLFGKDKLEGRNTDHAGLRQSLEENLGKTALNGKTVTLLGAGGAARGAVLALDQLGAAKIHILNRNAAKAAALAKMLQPLVKSVLTAGGLDEWAGGASEADLLVNTSSAGMQGNPPLNLDLALLSRKPVVVDIVYNPLETPLLKQAKAQGLAVIDGLGMLMHQAVPSFEAFFGVRPKVTPGLRAVLEQALT